MKNMFDAPQVINRQGSVYSLQTQDPTKICYRELIRIDSTQFRLGKDGFQTSSNDLVARIENGDIKVLVPSKSYLQKLRDRALAKSSREA